MRFSLWTVLLYAAFSAVLGLSPASATTWGPTPNSFGYYAVNTVGEGGNYYYFRPVNNPCSNVQFGNAYPMDDSFCSNNTTSNPAPMPIGFKFRFLGIEYDSVYISTNGEICLVNTDTASPYYNANKYSENDPTSSFNWDISLARAPTFTSSGDPIPTIGVWMEDMDCKRASLYYGNNSAGTAELVITWSGMNFLNSQITSSITCQCVIMANGKILLQYYASLNETDSTNGSADPGVGLYGPDLTGAVSLLAIYQNSVNSDGYPSPYTCYTVFPPPPPPTITVATPNGGESYFIGDSLLVTWTVTNGPLTQGADIEWSRDGGFTWANIGTGIADNNGGSYTWVITGTPSTQCMVRVSDTSFPSYRDASDGLFSVSYAAPAFAIVEPSGTGTLDFTVGDTMTIRWTATTTVGNSATLEISRNYGVSWTTIATNISPKTTSFYDWVITAPHSSGNRTCFVRIRDNLGTVAVNQQPFAIFDVQQFNITYPVGGETVFISTPAKILWQTQGLVGFFVTIELSRDGGINWETVTGGTNNDGEYDWTPVGLSSSTAKIRLTSTYSGKSYTSTTPGLFTISETAALAVTSPNGGEALTVGQRISITWSSRGTGVGNFVSIDISRDAGQTWQNVAEQAQNIGYYSWVVTGPITDRALISLSPVNNPTANDVSDNFFTITAPRGIYLVSPVGGESFAAGEIVDINWFTSGSTGTTVKLEVSRDNGHSWETIVADTPNNGGHAWVVTAPVSETCRIRISSNNYAEFSAISPMPFRITELIGVVVIEPFSSEIWETGTYRDIRWKPEILESGEVRIEISRAGTWEVIAVRTENDGRYEWFVSGPSVNCKVRISSLENLAKNYSSEVFIIIERYSLPYDCIAMDAAAQAGEQTSMSIVVNPETAFSNVEIKVLYNSAAISIPEPLAIIKGGAFSGWVMNVTLDNAAGSLIVNLVGSTAISMPAEAFSIQFSAAISAAGNYTVTVDRASFDSVASALLGNGKVAVTGTGGSGSPNVSGGGGGCFIASAAFGSLSASAVDSLCSVRDSFVSGSTSGSNLVSMYYLVSPAVAGSMNNSIRAVARKLLN